MENIIQTKEQWMDWAIRLQGIAQAGLYYTRDKYEIERYEQIRNIACEILATHSQVELPVIQKFFCSDTGYSTPKMDSRAVCIKDGKILMAQEESGLWSIPGGWIDTELSIAENTAKEAFEEAGAIVKPKFIIALHDWKKHIGIKFPNLPYQITKIFVMCELESINFKPNSETLQCDFFARDNLPKMAIGKNNEEQVALCFEAYDTMQRGEHWTTQFD